ncbi:magnesium transporter [Sulfurovum mangrovi]|uniref:magnesium transporter n=1 Tax=Sulfurovum mangrovi TaxID=2893889 RepID=UPI001E54D7FB|nr:magnesium transporter [Sulfurovum mangrovi]UFH59769.1 magnesium transporter [Sulfurovum mangrovi]UFH60571.1 magnesium transporter [Sulfurovum mangrovi]
MGSECMDRKSLERYLDKLERGTYGEQMSDADHADFLEVLKQHDEEKFFTYINLLSPELRGEILMELPIPFQVDYIRESDEVRLSRVIEALDSDDATNFYLTIVNKDREKSQKVFALLSGKRQTVIADLMTYPEDEAGALMQTELFVVPSYKSIDEAKEILSKLKKEGLGTVQSLFVTDERGKFIKTIPIDDLFLENPSQTFEEIIDRYPESYSVLAHESIDKVIERISKYDLTTLAVLDNTGYLLGRITHDDVVDAVQQSATQQIYNLSRLHETEEIQESFLKSTETRSVWLGINLVNAIVASLVIGIFEDTLSSMVALAILLPIVANMAGTASVQTMTVIIRQMALGNINFALLRPIFIKEFSISVSNGVIFGTASGIAAQVWFGNTDISIAIGLSMFVSLILGGVLGTTVPMMLKRMNFDPAVASSVIVITALDIIGFFSFLWFAELIAL